jgi:hypothetical protein
MPRRIEGDHDQQLAAFARDVARRIAVLAGDIDDAQAVREARRHLLVEKGRPLHIADLAVLGRKAKIEINLHGGLERRGACRRRRSRRRRAGSEQQQRCRSHRRPDHPVNSDTGQPCL